jgi:signal transduction histidine kinase/CheY-like chemotaxis protein
LPGGKKMCEQEKIKELEQKINELERENHSLRKDFSYPVQGNTVSVPDDIKPLFDQAQKTVGEYFRHLKMDPTRGTIEINDQRYVLVRASALSHDFLTTIQKLYSDRGEKEATSIGKNFLFDIAHVIGVNDAVNFHSKMNLKDPIEKLSAGPVHFAYSGWAFVDILPESNPSPDDNYYLVYNHPFSFEADSWIRSGQKSTTAVCIMNAGYSSGWCEQSFGLPLTAVEVTCKAKGDEHCTFIMSPPHRIQEHVEKFAADAFHSFNKKLTYDIPTFFERKKVEEEMRNARKKAEESDKAKSEFLANMSHEIRTPMNAIIGYVDLMLQDNITAEHRSYMETLKESGKLLLSLINDILDVSKIEAGQLVVENAPFSLKEVFDTSESAINAIISKSGSAVKLMRQYPADLPPQILSDQMRLQQVMFNLLSNAVKFTKDGTVEFGVKLNGQMLEFFVKDSGIGIQEKNHLKIFEMFGQADASSTRLHGGSGLGLTISKKLVELMGGKIWVKSELGIGSTFYFSLPYHPVETNDLAGSVNSAVLEVEKDCLLLVEDNIINQRLTKLILEKSGYQVITANNGEIAIELFRANKQIKLVLMDIQMPVLDGLAATEAIRKYEMDTNLERKPIIALTAHAMKGDKERCLEAGCDNYLSKPIMIDVLVRTIKKYL